MLSGLFYTLGPNASLTWPTKELLQKGEAEAEIELWLGKGVLQKDFLLVHRQRVKSSI